MRLEGVILHDALPGRLRVRILRLLRNPDACEDIARKALAVPGVTRANASPRTGSILIHFDRSRSHEEIAVALHLPSPHGARVLPPPHLPQLHLASVGLPRLLSSARHAPAPPPAALTLNVPRWHSFPAAGVLARLGVDAACGLAADEADRRLRATGANKLVEAAPADPFLTFLSQFKSLPVAMLLGATVFSVATGGIADAAITLAVLLANAGIGFGVERGSERVILRMTRPEGHLVPVLREGAERQVNSNDVVPGDVLVLRPNVVIAADARIVTADALQLNEALLTGESQSVAKSAGAEVRRDAALADRPTMVFRGSFVAAGCGQAVVVATGAATEVGRLTLTGADVATPTTPLERDLEKLGAQLALISLAICGGFFAMGVMRGRPIAGVLKSAIALAVAAVPEGLTVTSTATLALGLRKLKRKGVLVRRLESVEALGSMQVLCFDKTGTLTRDEMEVSELRLGEGAEPAPLRDAQPLEAARRLWDIAVLCSEVAVGTGGDLAGSATEVALVRAAMAMGLDPLALRRSWPQWRLEYRADGRRYMSSHHTRPVSGENLIALKGDPIQLLQMCHTVMRADGTLAPLDQAMRDRLLGANDAMAGEGLRVLGFAFAQGPSRELTSAELVWVGMTGLKAPIVTGAKELLSRLHSAGIRPLMITGDQSATAEAIARDIGLTAGRPVQVLDTVALAQIPPDLRDAIVERTDVFARVPPSQKLEIVRALQRSGKTVGMAGDGFNDALALKAADIAIAVGAGNASAARDVADIIVTGPDLNVIGDGIEQGRTILSNIRKSVHFMMATNLSELMVVFAEELSPRDQPESPLELLWLNLVTDIFPGLGLALEPPEQNVMAAPPRDASEPLLRISDLRHAAAEAAIMGGSILAAHGFGLRRYGPGSQTRSITFLSMVATVCCSSIRKG